MICITISIAVNDMRSSARVKITLIRSMCDVVDNNSAIHQMFSSISINYALNIDEDATDS